jgi:hypothetical protein
MSNIFSLVLIIGLAMFATGNGGRLTIPAMAIGVIGLLVSTFLPTSNPKKPTLGSKDWDQPF